MGKRLIFMVLISFSLVSFNSKDLFLKKIGHNEKSILNDTITWKKLGLVKFVKMKHKDYGTANYPVSSPEVKLLHNKKVVISGFLIPINNEDFALSKTVFSSCFFCGKEGPETVVGLKFKDKKIKLRVDQYVTITGVFKINEKDPDDWMYQMEKVVILKTN